MCFAVVPHPVGMIPAEEVKAKVDKAFNDIVAAATQWKPSQAADVAQNKPYPAKRIKFEGTYAELNKLFFNRKWSLSLPIIPPTPEKVAEMLKGTTHKPDEVLWVVPPRQGMLTVELAAALGVMAGCKPEHMPLMLATIEAFKHPDVSWRGTSTTTAPTVPMIIISGPIIEKLGINPYTGTAGAEQPVTNALGYFINLVGDVVGGSIPPDFDKSTHGTSADIVAMVFAENDRDNPWKQSYAAEQGFKPTDSVVTVFTAYLGGSNIDHNSNTGKSLLNTLALGILGSPSGIGSCFADYNKPYTVDNSVLFTFLYLCPEHADTIFREFPTKQAAKDYLLKVTKMPKMYYAPERCVPPKDMAVDENTLLPRYTSTDSIKIVVTGGPGKQSQIWSPFTQVLKPVSVLVKE